MARIGVRELRQHASRYIELVRGGETVEVTLRGMVVARLVPPAGDGWDQLLRAGRVRTATGDLHEVEPLQVAVAVSDELRAQRDDDPQ
jgi:antitoxin (DNA-binding transcriptional repressor) of toxin-antitoxin stability system